jgi:hypothetical protein
MRYFGLFLLAATVALCHSCSTDHRDLPTGFAYDPPPTPTDVVATGEEESSRISWSYPAAARASIGEFRVYQYLEAYDLLQIVGTTTDTVFVDSLLIGNVMYCYKVSAVDTAGFEGWRTASVCAFVKSRSMEAGEHVR